jgi:hypothetical protein
LFESSSFRSSVVDVDLAGVVAARGDRLQVLLLKLVVKLLEGCVTEGRLTIADGDRGVALLDDDLLEVVDTEFVLPVSLTSDVALSTHVEILVLEPGIGGSIFEHVSDFVDDLIFTGILEEIGYLLDSRLSYSEFGRVLSDFHESSILLLQGSSLGLHLLEYL